MLSFQVLLESVSQNRHYEVIKAGASDLYTKHSSVCLGYCCIPASEQLGIW